MKLQKQKAYEYKGKHHHKFAIVVPEKTINELGWKEGQELETEVKGDKLVIKKED